MIMMFLNFICLLFAGIVAGEDGNPEISTECLSCSFVQTRQSAMLQDKAVSEGRMYFSAPDKVRWEYVSPFRHVFVMAGDKAFVFSDGKRQELDMGRAGMFKGIASIMLAGVSGESSDSFRIVRDGSRMTLTPLRRDMKKMFAKVELVLSDDGLPVTVSITESNGDSTLIEFSGHSAEQIDGQLFIDVK